MRLTAILLTVAFMAVKANGLSQTVTFSCKDLPLEKVCEAIKKQTGYVFFFNNEIWQVARPVTVTIKNATIQETLNLVMKGQPLEYIIEDKTIIISKKKELVVTTPAASNNAVPPIDVHGRILDEKNDPVIASIQIKGTNQGTTSNQNGEFSLVGVDANATLIISGVGIETTEVRINNNNFLNVILKISVGKLEETIIKGYYVTTKRFNTGSVSKMTSQEISKQPVTNLLDALIGNVPGLFITPASGVPGSALSVQLRGQNSLANGNDPLYLIDGVPFTSTSISSRTLSQNITGGGNPFSNLNPADIESIEILKDADATAIYGSRGANGVILITTKKGKSGKPSLDLNYYIGAGSVSKFLSLLNTEKYLEMRNEAFKNDGRTPGASDYDINGKWDSTRYTDWQKTLSGRTAITHNINMSFSGGNNYTQFRISGNYLKQSTVFPGDFGDNRAIASFSLNHSSNNQKLKVSLSTSYSIDKNNLFSVDLTSFAILTPPNAPRLYDDLGNLNWEGGTFSNPLSATLKKYDSRTTTLINDASLSYQVLPSLNIGATAAYTRMSMNEIQTNPLSSFNPTGSNTLATIFTDFAANSIETWIIEPQLNWKKTFGKGKIEALAGATLQQNINQGQILEGTGFNSELLMESISAATSIKAFSESNIKYKYSSGFGRLSYTYNNKYVVNFTGRRDGSSRFGPGRQFANFHSIGFAWVFSDETLLKRFAHWLSFGKFRTSYGTSGNDQIGDYQYLDTWGSTTYQYLGSTGLQPLRLFNSDFRWEENRKIEMAVELAFFNKLIINCNYYLNRSNNQLVGYSLAPSTGFSSVQFNLPAVVQNSGLEFEISSSNINSKYLVWKTSANLTIPRSKLVSFPNIENYPIYANSYEVGMPLTIFKGFRSTGVDPSTGIYTFEDVDKDGKISWPNDLQPLKNRGQDFYGGFQNSFQYRNFQIDVLFQFAKQTGFGLLKAYIAPPGVAANQPEYVVTRWQKAGDNSTVQKYSRTFGSAPYSAYTNANQYGEQALVDASFIRLRNISISYQLPKAFQRKLQMQGLRVYAQGQNIFTITNFDGYDPQRGSAGTPPLRLITIGIQATF